MLLSISRVRQRHAEVDSLHAKNPRNNTQLSPLSFCASQRVANRWADGLFVMLEPVIDDSKRAYSLGDGACVCTAARAISPARAGVLVPGPCLASWSSCCRLSLFLWHHPPTASGIVFIGARSGWLGTTSGRPLRWLGLTTRVLDSGLHASATNMFYGVDSICSISLSLGHCERTASSGDVVLHRCHRHVPCSSFNSGGQVKSHPASTRVISNRSTNEP